jgi:hypothetical protein
MLRAFLVFLVAAAAGLAAPHPGYAATAAFPEGSRIGLVLPPGDLKPSVKAPGFEDSARKVTITILDLPGPAYEALEQSAFGKKIKGLTIDKRELFTFAGGLGYLITGRAKIDGEDAHAWYLLANTMTRQAGRVGMFIRVHVPDAARAAYPDAAIRAALKTVTFRMPPLAELVKKLPFKLGDLAGFRLMRVAPPALAVLIDGPVNDPVHHPYMVISVGRGAPQEPGAQARLARDLLNTAPVRVDAITSAETIRLRGAPVYELRANAKGPDGSALELVQWLRFGSSGFLRIVGVVQKDDWDKLFPRFRAVRDGIDPR